ncbi:MAG TPA: ATP-binding protein [Gaiellaceae bacterium]|nr:ATP-binding protein [Gaiellaceae bacterium]
MDAAAAPVQAAETLKRKLMRLALDVHDGPMQNLAVIGFSLGDLRRRMEQIVPPEHHTKLDAGMEQITEELGRVENELRGLIVALEHGTKHTLPVVEAIETEIAEFEKRTSATCELSVTGNVQTDTDSQRIALQSVTRAALANVSKHAGAKNVAVRLRGTPRTITLEVEDDGNGFDSSQPTKNARFGLAGMRERVELLGGKFEIASRPGGPTKVTATLKTWRPPAA